MLAGTELPVLMQSLSALERLRDDADESPQQIADVVLRDPLLTVNLLRYVQEHRARRRSTEITTVTHAVMMLGITPFHEKFQTAPAVEATLEGHADALTALRQVIRRARLAAWCARDWARTRKDIDPEEVMVAALLRDFAEMLLCCVGPKLVAMIARLQKRDPVVGADAARQQVLGFPLLDLQHALVRVWRLPELLRMTLDPQYALHPRVLNIEYAAAVAAHAAPGWDSVVLADDFLRVGAWLGMAPEEVRQGVIRIAAET